MTTASGFTGVWSTLWSFSYGLVLFLFISDDDEQNQRLLAKIKHVELELANMKSELLGLQGVKACCDSMDTLHGKVHSAGIASLTVGGTWHLCSSFDAACLSNLFLVNP